VGRWIGHVNAALLDALQVEAVLPERRDCTEVYFDPLYRGGYGWLFPKGEEGTANVGVGVNRALGGDPRPALDHLLDRLGISPGAVVGRTAGPVPSGGSAARLRVGNVLLVGDAAGHTHPITGAGVFAAVVSGALAGQAAARAVQRRDETALDEYGREWDAFMARPLRHALERRRSLDARWSDAPIALSAVIRQTWIAFKAYGQHKKSVEEHR
jgi:flavin-dependent dehydrogenase